MSLAHRCPSVPLVALVLVGPVSALAQTSELPQPALATTLQNLHPMRLQRRMLSDRVPGAAQLGTLAEDVRNPRQPVAEDNLFLRTETLMAELVEHWLDVYRDVRDAWYAYLLCALRQSADAQGRRDA